MCHAIFGELSCRFMNHHDFGFDEAFGEQMGNFEVYQGTARQIVQNALEGKSGTVMMPLEPKGVGDGFATKEGS